MAEGRPSTQSFLKEDEEGAKLSAMAGCWVRQRPSQHLTLALKIFSSKMFFLQKMFGYTTESDTTDSLQAAGLPRRGSKAYTPALGNVQSSPKKFNFFSKKFIFFSKK